MDEAQPDQFARYGDAATCRVVFHPPHARVCNAQEADSICTIDISKEQFANFLPARAGVPNQQQHEKQAIVYLYAARFKTLLFLLATRPGRQMKDCCTLLNRNTLADIPIVTIVRLNEILPRQFWQTRHLRTQVSMGLSQFAEMLV